MTTTYPPLPEAWTSRPVSHVCPPCPSCTEPPRIHVDGSAVLRHRAGCPVKTADAIRGQVVRVMPDRGRTRGLTSAQLAAECGLPTARVVPVLEAMAADGVLDRWRNGAGTWRWSLR